MNPDPPPGEPLVDTRSYRIVVPPSRHYVEIIIRDGHMTQTIIHGVAGFCDPTVPIIFRELLDDA